MAVIVQAPAKINLGLEIGNRRPDGYHPLETFMQTVALFDTVTLNDSSVFSFISAGYDFPQAEKNLCRLAYEMFCDYCRIDQAVSIDLLKRIPVGAGIGGGSSDAAAVIRGLNRLWNTGLTTGQMAEIGTRIGSDVPFFIAATEGAAFCSGRGEIIEPLPAWWKGWAVIVFTGLHISTAEAYKNFDENLTNCQKSLTLKRFISSCFPVYKGLNDVKNDFSEIVFSKHPVLQEVVLSLDRQGSSYSSLSGSGSAVYGLFNTKYQAEIAAADLDKFGQVFSVETPVPHSSDLLQIN